MKKLTFDDFVGNEQVVKKARMLIHAAEENSDARIPDMAFLGASGYGKAQPLTADVLTPSGFVKMSELSIGQKVCTPNGDHSTIIGIFPQGKIPVYKISFSDGTSTLCSKEHLWLTKTALDREKNKPGSIKTTQEILDSLLYCEKSNHSIPQTLPVIFEIQNKPDISPYVLGCFLGDAYLSTKGCIRFSSSDLEIIEKINNELNRNNCTLNKVSGNNYDYRVVKNTGGSNGPNEIKNIIKRLGLLGKKSHEKFIPSNYLTLSVGDRISLLKGLMDTDGTIKLSTTKASCQVSFSSTSFQLTKDVRFLVESLGGTARISERFTSYTHKGVKKTGRKSFRLDISLASINPFSLKRKADLFIPRTKYKPTRYIRSIVPYGEEECQCIKISNNNGLYLTNNFIVTHNTTLARIIAHHLDREFVEINSTVVRDPFQFRSYIISPVLNNRGAIILLDECQRLRPKIQDNLLSATEKPRQLHTSHKDQVFKDKLQENISFIFATTHGGLIRTPLMSRLEPLEFLDYSLEEKIEMVVRYLHREHGIDKEQFEIDAVVDIAKRSRSGRHVVKNCDNIIRFMKLEGVTNISKDIVDKAFEIIGIDKYGLTRLDRKLLSYLAKHNSFIGLGTLEALMNIPKKDIQDNIEPWLIRQNFIVRRSAGRIITKKGVGAVKGQ